MPRPVLRHIALGLVTVVLLAGIAVLHRGASAFDTPPAEECSTVPLTESELVEIVTLGTDRIPLEEATNPTATADDETIAAVSATIRMSVACANANLPMSSLALFSDDYIAQRFSGEGQDDLGHLLAALSRAPAVATEAELLSLDAVEDVGVLADGRVIATVVTSNAQATFVDRLVLIETDEGWLIDEVAELDPAATPTASQ